MKFRSLLWVALLLILGGGAWAVVSLRSRPPEAPFARVVREAIASSVPTNGKVEPIEWAEAKAERAGAVERLLIQKGQRVEQGAALIELDSREAQAELAAAQARVSQARAELDVAERGGNATDLAAIVAEADKARLELAAAQKERDALVRLQAKQAATSFEVTQAKDRVDQAELQIRSLEQKRAALGASQDRTAIEARLHDGEAAVKLAQERIRKSVVRAPIAGTAYQFDLKPGAYLAAGDLVATVGRLDRVRVKVYVDEPDLGRVKKGMPVVITWDAMPGRQWKGNVDQTASQIVALGTRQVGEVTCVIENPGGDLLPGTNVNVDIRPEAVDGALTIPKEAVRRQLGEAGVFILNGSSVIWKKIELGVGNTTRTQVSGLNEGDAVALPSDAALKDGMVVSPQFR